MISGEVVIFSSFMHPSSCGLVTHLSFAWVGSTVGEIDIGTIDTLLYVAVFPIFALAIGTRAATG